MRKISFLLILFIYFVPYQAQELNCVVNVNYQQLEGSERTMFKEMEKAVFQLVNGTKWTNDEFKIHERIDCSILITLEERAGSNEYKGNIQVQASRPVYNSSYNSPIVNIRDEDFVVRYNQFEPLQFNRTSYSGELTQIIAFYVYMILGYDYDSFSPEGGTPFFQQAQRIVANAQSSAQKGWKAFESQRNRYWLIENILSARFKPMRKMFYEYHRNGFDMLHRDVSRGRNLITQSLKSLRPIHNVAPSSYNMQVLFNAKMQEVVNLYSRATAQEKEEISALLITIDPGNANNYEKIRKSR